MLQINTLIDLGIGDLKYKIIKGVNPHSAI